MDALLRAFIADAVDYLMAHLDPTRPLGEQKEALDALARAMPGLDDGERNQVVLAELDGSPPEELFLVPHLNGFPLLYTRYISGTWQGEPVITWPIEEPCRNAANLPNVWPASAQVVDVTGDDQPEVIVTHTFSGASNWRDMVQVLRRTEMGFTPIFRAELVNWAGESRWELVPAGAAEDIRLTYPAFFWRAHEAKMTAHPQGEQLWRYDPTLGRYTLFTATITIPPQVPLNWQAGDWLKMWVNRAEDLLQQADYPAARQAFQEVLEKAAAVNASQLQPDWVGYSHYRLGQLHAILGNEEAALRELALAGEAGAPLDKLVAAFRETYTADPTDSDRVIKAWLAVVKVAQELSRSDLTLGGNLGFPVNSLAVGFPSLAVPLYLDRHPLSDAASLKAALADLGFSPEALSVSDLDSDGTPEVVFQPGVWQQSKEWQWVWLVYRGDTSWRLVAVAQATRFTLAEVPGRARPVIVVQGGIYPDPNRRRGFAWENGRLLPVDPDTGREVVVWPVVGWMDY